MTIGLLHRVSLSASVALGALGVAGGSELTAVAACCLILAAVLFGGSFLDVERSRPRTWLVHALTVVLLLYALAIFREARIDAVLAIIILGVGNRLALRSGQRDDFIILGATSVLMVIATTIMPGVAFLALILTFVPCSLWALWTTMLLGLNEHQAEPRMRAEALRRLAMRLIPKLRLQIALWSWALMLGGFLLVSLLPRHNFGGFLAPGYFASLPGASSAMELTHGGVSDFGGGGVTVRVEPQSQEYRERLQGLYARVYSLDLFDGRRWSSSRRPGMFPLHPPSERFRGRDGEWAEDDGPDVVRVSMQRLVPRGEPNPAVTLGRTGPAYVRIQHVEQDASGTWFLRVRGASPQLSYLQDLERVPLLAELPAGVQTSVNETLVEVPPGTDPRIVALGRELASGKEGTQEKLRSILDYLGRGFSYSLEPLPGVSEDPLARFLFEAKQGHCELYAGALALLLRVGGVKARVVTGYYSGWWNARGGYLQFEDQDAHAWVELIDERGRVVWADATPAGRRARRRASALAFLRDVYDALEALWFDRVVDFDEAKRRRLLSDVYARLDGLESAFSWPRESPKTERAQGVRRFAAGLGFLAALVLAGVMLVLRPLRRRAPEALGQRLREILGARPQDNVTLGALLLKVPEEYQHEARVAVESYESLRFGPPELAPDGRAVEAQIEALRKSLRKGH